MKTKDTRILEMKIIFVLCEFSFFFGSCSSDASLHSIQRLISFFMCNKHHHKDILYSWKEVKEYAAKEFNVFFVFVVSLWCTKFKAYPNWYKTSGYTEKSVETWADLLKRRHRLKTRSPIRTLLNLLLVEAYIWFKLQKFLNSV